MLLKESCIGWLYHTALIRRLLGLFQGYPIGGYANRIMAVTMVCHEDDLKVRYGRIIAAVHVDFSKSDYGSLNCFLTFTPITDVTVLICSFIVPKGINNMFLKSTASSRNCSKVDEEHSW